MYGYSPMHQQQAAGWYPNMMPHPGFTTPTGIPMGGGQPTPNRTRPFAYPTTMQGGGGYPSHHLQKPSSTTPTAQSAVKISMPLMPNFTPHPVPPTALSGGGISASKAAGTGTTPGSAATTIAQQRVNPISGKTLERDLQLASKEELIQVLLDVSACHASAASFVYSKAQLFSLRGAMPQQIEPTKPDQDKVAAPQQAAAVDENHTPTRELTFDDTPMQTPDVRVAKAAAQQHAAEMLSSPVPPRSACKHTPAKACPETRVFNETLHPCLRLHGSCRHSTSCIFRSLPSNVCLLWIRGSCAGGRDCGCVHRLPPNCPSQVQAVFDLSHGGDRAAMAQRAAAREAESPNYPQQQTGDDDAVSDGEGEHGMSHREPTELEDTAIGLSTPREQMTVCANRREPRSGPNRDDEEGTVEGRQVARCLNDSFDLAVEVE